MEHGASEIVKRLKSDCDNPNEYDALVTAWNKLCDRTHSDNELSFADVEKAAIAALSDTTVEQTTGIVGHEISRSINSFEYPTYLVSSEGSVVAVNLSAWKEYNLDIHDSIDKLPFKFNKSVKISQLVKQLTQKQTAGPTLILKRSSSVDQAQEATIAITVSHGKNPTVLVFVITTRWKPGSLHLLKEQYGLTDAEASVLSSFVDGYSTQEIATQRSRSYQTVRTQFNSIREKMGAKNQTELLRSTLSVSDFSTGIGRLTNAIEHPNRRKSENIRAGGRLVEATMMGDFSGTPIVMLAAISHYTFNAEFEQVLSDAKLLVISICPPGYGKSDPTPDGVSWIDQAEDDVLGVMDQLGISKCVLLIKYTTAPMSYRIARQNPSRFSHIVQLSTCGPLVYDKPKDSRSRWISGMLKASFRNNAIARILLTGYIKSWVTIGARQFMRLQMSENPYDAEYVQLQENVTESQYALDTATRHGISGAVQEHELVLGDWTADISTIKTNMTFIYGVENTLFSIEGARTLAALFPKKINLIEIENAGFAVSQSHPEKVVEILRSVIES